MSDTRVDSSSWLLIFLCILSLSSCRTSTDVSPVKAFRGPSSYAVYYGAARMDGALSRVDWAIVQDTYVPTAYGHTVYIAYLSLGEIDPETTVAREVARQPGGLGAVTLGMNRFWHSRVADIRKGSFRRALLAQIGRDMENGYGGIFFDTLDSPLEYRRNDPGKGAGIRRAMESFIETVHVSYPMLTIVVNRGFDILPKIAPSISGVLFEDFCSRFDETKKIYVAVRERGRRRFLKDIVLAKSTNPGLVVLTLDYDDPARPRFSEPCGQIARKYGFLHYSSDWNLMTLDPALSKAKG